MARPKRSITPDEAKYLKLQELKLEEERLVMKEGLPHLYGLKWYSWQWNFFQSRNRMSLMTAANQVGKSSVLIRKCIHWATEKSLWKTLWPSTPRQFWYFYPSSDTAVSEFETKWVPEFLPRGKFESDAKYGWDCEYDKKRIKSLTFKSGLTIFFKSYEQDISNLQAGTVHMVALDEEAPEEFMPELLARTSAATTQGYVDSVFTATLGQDFWRRAMEPHEDEKENFPDAFKQQISLYDCMTYRDGTPGPWTEDMIKSAIARCSTPAEVQKRIFGKFVISGGRTYPTYNPEKNFVKPYPIPRDWIIYSGMDSGSGGEEGHPAAISVVAVRPDFQKGALFKFWRGDGITTTSGDILEKHREMTLGLHVTNTKYDHADKDLETIATRQGESVQKANKSHVDGEGILNTLFKNQMLDIFDDEAGEGAKISGEFLSLKKNTLKTKAKDDGIDSLRYTVVSIPWDFDSIVIPLTDEEKEALKVKPKIMTDAELLAEHIRERRGERMVEKSAWGDLDDDFEEWNDLME